MLNKNKALNGFVFFHFPYEIIILLLTDSIKVCENSYITIWNLLEQTELRQKFFTEKTFRLVA